MDCYGYFQSALFYPTSDFYWRQLTVDYDRNEESLDIYLHHYGDADDEEERWVQTIIGFGYKMYFACNNGVVDSNSVSLTYYSFFNIVTAYQRSKRFVCLKLSFEGITH